MLQGNTVSQNKTYREALDERRQFTRYRSKADAFVLISSESNKLYGFLVDISKGGISFEYIPEKEDMLEPKELKIVLDGTNLRFDSLSSISISDIEINDPLYTPVNIRRRSVQFVDLTQEQLSNLEWFLQGSELELTQVN